MKPSEIVQALAADLAQYLDKRIPRQRPEAPWATTQQVRVLDAGMYLPHNLASIMQTFIVDWMLDHNVSIKDDQAPKDKIVVEVSGGVVQSIQDIPKDVVVEVHDYDVEGEDESGLETDGNGDHYHCGVWET